ncbi:unnamed protein product [Lathyrus oleraceus]
MIAAGACFSPISFSPILRKQLSHVFKPKSCSIMSIAPTCFAMSVNFVPAMDEKHRQSGWKEYLQQAKDLIEADGGPPRWFSPLDCGSPPNNSLLMLFLPGQSLFQYLLLKNVKSIHKSNIDYNAEFLPFIVKYT